MALGERDVGERFAGRIVEWGGAYLISFVGLLHLLLSGEHFGYAPYLGLLFLANFIGASISAVFIARTGRRWAWLLGVAVAGGALVALAYSRTLGLPGYPDGVRQWFNFAAWMALAFELSFLAVVPLALTSRGRALVGAEQERVDRERLPPDRQETPEHFELIEKDMREIQARMRPDLRDLRNTMEPRALGEKAKLGVRQRLRVYLRGRRK